jgi:hypothetical protein
MTPLSRTALALPWALLLLTSCVAVLTTDPPVAAGPARPAAAPAHPIAGGQPEPTYDARVTAGQIYHCSGQFGFRDEASHATLRRVTALLEPGRTTLVLTLPDGVPKAFRFAPRPRSQWQGDCATMRGSVLCEVADLVPVNGHPLVLGGRTFSQPVIKMKCSSSRMVLSEGKADAEPCLILDLNH